MKHPLIPPIEALSRKTIDLEMHSVNTKEMIQVVMKHPIGVVDRESIPWELFNGPAYEVETLPAESDSEVTVEHCYIASASFGAGSCCALPFADIASARAFLGAAKQTSLVDGDVYLTIYRAAIVWVGIPGLTLQSTRLLTDAWLDADQLAPRDDWRRFADPAAAAFSPSSRPAQ